MIEFKSINNFKKGILYEQLVNAYSFNNKCKEVWEKDWLEYDNFFFSNYDIADKYGFVTVLDGKPIGHITWDPRNRPDYVIIGHNCIISEYKGMGYGKIQLQEALKRIKEYGVKKVVVTTNEITLAAQKNYESVGFIKVHERENNETTFAGKYIDYEMFF